MSIVMKASEFVAKLNDIATNYKTLYVMGCFGAPMNTSNKKRYCNNHDYNKKDTRTKMIQSASTDTFGFDCVNLIKGVLWGWTGDTTKTYGGAKYASNGVPDTSANGMIKLCKDVTTDFSNIQVGEAVWCSGHIGVYIGDGLAIESTPAWKNNVQITAVKNIGAKSGYNARTWTKHGKLPYIEYDVTDTPKKLEVKATEAPKSKDKTLAGTYEVTTNSLYVRNAPLKKPMTVIPKGTKVNNYGYYTETTSGVKWLYVQFTYEDVVYTGFCSSRYLKKK